MKWLVLLLVGCATVALAQQQQPPDPAFLQQALIAVQGQRNQALDAMAACQAHDQMLAEELRKAKGRIAELEKAAADKPP